MAEQLRRQRKRARGVVKSDKMDKTITVTVERLVRDPRYGKYVRRKSSFAAHDPENRARSGDLVEIEDTRPLSRTKHWRLVRVVRRARGAEAAGPVQATPQAEAFETESSA